MGGASSIRPNSMCFTLCRTRSADSPTLIGLLPSQHLQGQLQGSVPLDLRLFSSCDSPKCPNSLFFGVLVTNKYDRHELKR